MLFAGTTVVISLLGMLLMGVTFVQGLAVGAAAVVAITVAASLTLLPAFLGFAGERIERMGGGGLIAAGLVAVALVGRPRPSLMTGLPLALVVIIAGFFWEPLKREVRRRPPKPWTRPPPTAGAGSSSAGPGPPPSSACWSWCCWPCPR